MICSTNNFAGNISGKQLASYCGVVPFGHSSCTSIKRRNKVHKMANKNLKKLLHMGPDPLQNITKDTGNIMNER